MSDEPAQIPADAPAPSVASRVELPPPAVEAADAHPEFVVAGAFAGAWIFAKILKRIGGS